jgi:tRNA-intron endonuclease
MLKDKKVTKIYITKAIVESIMEASLVEDKIIVDDQPSIDRLHQKGFGKKVEDKLELSLLEGLFLLERESLKIFENKKEVAKKDILKRVEEKEFMLRYRVYKDLRERGYIVKTGFKFGAHFRVYERGEFLTEHSKYLVHAVPENYVISFPEMARAIRLTQGVKKKIMFAVVDDEGDITYYMVERITP